MPARRRNPQARPEFVDELTGQRVAMGAPGGRRTGRLLARVRAPKADSFELVPVDPEDLDPARDTYGIDPSATPRLKTEAEWVAGAKKPAGKAMTRGQDLDLGRAGATTTFSSNKKAAQTFMEQNAHLFEAPLFEDIDIYDVTLDFMDGIEVRSGNRFVRLSKTNRGEEILRGSGRSSGGAVAEEMLAYLMGYAGSRRRWRDVPWHLVTSYVMKIQETMQEEAQRKKVRAPGGGVRWYPLSSGMYSPEEMLTIAIDEIGESRAQRLADWMNSQALFDLADRMEKVLAPPKGSQGKAARRAKKCLTLADRKAIRRRLETIETWAKYPASVPQWACVSSRETEATAVSLCVYPGLEQEVRNIENACAGYDPSWPAKERARLCAAGDAEATEYGAGVAPLGCPEDVVLEDDSMSVPWENPTAWQKAMRGPKKRRQWKVTSVEQIREATYAVHVDAGSDGCFTATVYPDGFVQSGTRRLEDKEIEKIRKAARAYVRSRGDNPRRRRKNPEELSDFERDRIAQWRSDARRMMAGERVRGQTGRAGVERLADRASSYAASITLGRPFGSTVTDPRTSAYGSLAHELRALAAKNPRRRNPETRGETMCAWIKARLAEGQSVYVQTQLRTTVIKPKNADLVRSHKGHCQIARGKKWDIIDYTRVSARYDNPTKNPDADDEFDDEDESDAPQSYKDFSAWIRALAARRKEFIAEHRAIFERDGIVSVPGYDGRYTLVLTRGTTSPYRVTDFLGDEPTGHSERNTLEDALVVLWEDATSEYKRSPPQPKRANPHSSRRRKRSRR